MYLGSEIQCGAPAAHRMWSSAVSESARTDSVCKTFAGVWNAYQTRLISLQDAASAILMRWKSKSALSCVRLGSFSASCLRLLTILFALIHLFVQ